MKVVKFCLLPLILFLVLVVVGGWLWGRSLPDQWTVERSHTIAAPPAEIHPHLADLRAWEAWMVWLEKDPTMKLSYSGEPGVGMSSSWTGKDGNGSQEIIASEVAVGITTRTSFDGFTPFESTIHFAPDGDGTRVTWRSAGTASNWGERVFGAFADDLMGPDFEGNLANLDRVVTAAE